MATDDDSKKRKSGMDDAEFDDKENFGVETEEDDDDDDFFNSDAPDDEEEEKPRAPKVKKKVFTSDDPRYWESDASRWEHLRPSRPLMLLLYLLGTLLGIGILWWAYIQLFGVYQDEGVQYGYVESVSKEGKVFKTFEGVVLPYREISDTTRVYDHDFRFSIKNDSISAWLYRMEASGIPVRLEYKVYNTALPWRGNSKIMVINADTADASKLLPPEFAPKREVPAEAPADNQ